LSPAQSQPRHARLGAGQVMHARWGALLAMRAPPPTARGLCARGGPEYAALVFRYARTLVLAARAAGAAARGGGAAAARLAADADAELVLLQARPPRAAPVTG